MPDRYGSTGNTYRYGYQGSEKDDEVKGEGDSYTTHYRLLDPRVGRWLTRDPKETAFESPYVSMRNNPILFNDVLGDTIIKGINPRNKRDKMIYEGPKKQKDEKNSIHLFVHGNPNQIFIYNENTGVNTQINTPEEFDDYMSSQKIPEWEKAKKGGNITVILHSCRTGADTADSKGILKDDDAFAKRLSKYKPNISVIAPTERDYFNEKGELGPYKTTNTDINGEKIHRSRVVRWILGENEYKRTKVQGEWRVYRDGKVVKTHDATWKPTRKGSGR